MVIDRSLADRAQEARDLRRQLGGLEATDQEIVFKDTSPRARRTIIWSMLDGREISIPLYALDRTLAKTDEKGNYLFTGRQHEAPVFTPGTVKCFLHPESEERPVLAEIGLANAMCAKATLANDHAKRTHAQTRHPSVWEAYQEHIKRQEERDWRDAQRAQTEATLELARAAAANAPKAKATKAGAEE